MKPKTEFKLKNAYQICVDEDRSIEYTIEFMKQYANVDHDCIMNYLYKNRDK